MNQMLRRRDDQIAEVSGQGGGVRPERSSHAWVSPAAPPPAMMAVVHFTIGGRSVITAADTTVPATNAAGVVNVQIADGVPSHAKLTPKGGARYTPRRSQRASAYRPGDRLLRLARRQAQLILRDQNPTSDLRTGGVALNWRCHPPSPEEVQDQG